MHRNIISKLLSRPDINIFDELIKEIEAYFHRSVYSIQDMKDRDNKKTKGDFWELFCKDWLVASGKYINVWLLNDFNTQFDLDFSKQDNGIDLIAQTATGWVAIQCKYRGRGKYVDWKSLSTFIGLCERTGPWEKYLVITNCVGISRKLPRTPKDQSICRKTFQNTTREHWMKMVGTYQPHTLKEEITMEITNLDGSINNVTWETTSSVPKTLEELRAIRLSKFSQPNN
jgi:hypothetical protein